MSGKDKIDPQILKLMEEQKRLGGVDTRKLEPGTRVEVQTKNSLYKFEFLDQEGKCTVQGGKYFPEPVETVFPGSTWGGSMLKIGWIGYKMRMELPNPNKPPGITTSPVFKAKVFGANWMYEMDW